MKTVRRVLRRIVDFSTLVAVPFLLVVGVGDLLAGDLEQGGLEVAISLIAALTTCNSRSSSKASLRTHVTGVRPWEALIGFLLFALFGLISVANAARDEQPRVSADIFGAILLFGLAVVALWVLWRARSRDRGS